MEETYTGDYFSLQRVMREGGNMPMRKWKMVRVYRMNTSMWRESIVQSLKLTCILQYCFRKFADFNEIIDGLLTTKW